MDGGKVNVVSRVALWCPVASFTSSLHRSRFKPRRILATIPVHFLEGVATHASEITSLPVNIRVAKGNFSLLSAMALETNLVAYTVARLFVAIGAVGLVSSRVNG